MPAASRVINRGTLPQDFLDSSTALMRLPSPEPQYWFARAILGANLRMAALNTGMKTAQQFVSEVGGGQMVDPDLDSLVRAADAYPDTIQIVDGFGLSKGDQVKFTRDKYDGGGYDKASRKLVSGNGIATTGQVIKMEEVPVTLEEFTGPFANGASNVEPYAISDFASKYLNAKESLTSATSRFLMQDYVKWLDTVVRDEFTAKSKFWTYPSAAGFTDASSFVAGGAATYNLQQWLRARKTLSDRNYRKFRGGRYVGLVPTAFNTDMVGDQDYKDLSKNHEDGRNQLYGYIGSVQDIDFFEVSTLKQYVAGDVTADGGSVASGVTLNTGLLLGPGAVGFASALDPECRWADDTNYGTVAKCIWYALHAFEMLDTRGVQLVFGQDA